MSKQHAKLTLDAILSEFGDRVARLVVERRILRTCTHRAPYALRKDVEKIVAQDAEHLLGLSIIKEEFREALARQKKKNWDSIYAANFPGYKLLP